jgi:hypothetical protein
MTTAPTDGELIAAAKSYVDALVSHDPSGVPFHPDCVRIELGVKTGRNGNHLRRSLARGPQFRLIHTIDEFTAVVTDGDEAKRSSTQFAGDEAKRSSTPIGRVVHTTFYVHVHPKPLRLRALVTESFEFDETGRIVKIVAKFGVPRRH